MWRGGTPWAERYLRVAQMWGRLTENGLDGWRDIFSNVAAKTLYLESTIVFPKASKEFTLLWNYFWLPDYVLYFPLHLASTLNKMGPSFITVTFTKHLTLFLQTESSQQTLSLTMCQASSLGTSLGATVLVFPQCSLYEQNYSNPYIPCFLWDSLYLLQFSVAKMTLLNLFFLFILQQKELIWKAKFKL